MISFLKDESNCQRCCISSHSHQFFFIPHDVYFFFFCQSISPSCQNVPICSSIHRSISPFFSMCINCNLTVSLSQSINSAHQSICPSVHLHKFVPLRPESEILRIIIKLRAFTDVAGDHWLNRRGELNHWSPVNPQLKINLKIRFNISKKFQPQLSSY